MFHYSIVWTSTGNIPDELPEELVQLSQTMTQYLIEMKQIECKIGTREYVWYLK